MDGTLGFSLIPEEIGMSIALKYVSDEVAKLTGQDANLVEIRQLYDRIKGIQYKLYPLQTRRHDKALRFKLILEELSRVKGIKTPVSMVDKIMDLYWEVFESKAEPYPQTHSTLEALKRDYKVIIITNNGKEEGERKRKIFGLESDKHYDLFITSEELHNTCKPSEKYFGRVLSFIKSSLDIDASPKKIVIIGDDPSGDIALANMCGVSSVRIKKDLHSSEQPRNDLERACVEINEINELLGIL